MAGVEALTATVAKSLFKLMSYKDEYEVARLYTNGDFIRNLKSTFQGDYKLQFHMAPPIMEATDPATGRPQKRAFGPWMLGAMRADVSWIAVGAQAGAVHGDGEKRGLDGLARMRAVGLEDDIGRRIVWVRVHRVRPVEIEG